MKLHNFLTKIAFIIILCIANSFGLMDNCYQNIPCPSKKKNTVCFKGLSVMEEFSLTLSEYSIYDLKTGVRGTWCFNETCVFFDEFGVESYKSNHWGKDNVEYHYQLLKKHVKDNCSKEWRIEKERGSGLY